MWMSGQVSKHDKEKSFRIFAEKQRGPFATFERENHIIGSTR